MGARILAAIAAVAMIVGAVVVRARLDDDGALSTGTSALKLVCATELQAVCDSLAGPDVSVTVEPAAVTAARLQSVDAEDAGIDGWVAPGPWGEIVDSARNPSAGRLFADAKEPLARSPLVLAVWKDKRGALNCAEPINLGCVGDAVNAERFRLGVAADDEAEGVLADAALGAGHLNNSDFATNDIDETDLAAWLTTVDQNADRVGRNPGGRSVSELLTFGTAVADGFLTIEAEAGPEVAQAARRNQLDLLYVAPVATADVLFAARPGGRGNDLRERVDSDRVRDVLSASGWRVTGKTPVAGIDVSKRLPGTDGLPSGGVLHALMDITR